MESPSVSGPSLTHCSRFVVWIHCTLYTMNYDRLDACPAEIVDITTIGTHYIRSGIIGALFAAPTSAELLLERANYVHCDIANIDRRGYIVGRWQTVFYASEMAAINLLTESRYYI